MAYYVWLEYYCAAPVSKNVKSDELKYADKHVHGLQPTTTQQDSLLPSLYANVGTAYATYNQGHPDGVLAVPSNAAIQLARQVKTRSAH